MGGFGASSASPIQGPRLRPGAFEENATGSMAAIQQAVRRILCLKKVPWTSELSDSAKHSGLIWFRGDTELVTGITG